MRRVVEPLLSGAAVAEAFAADDLRYVRDLGLVTRVGPVAVANPIHREVIPRDLTYTTQEMSFHHDPAWYIDGDRALRVGELLAAFQAFFREHSEHWVERFQYREAGPQLLLQDARSASVCSRRAPNMDLRAAAEGHLVIFDRDEDKSWDEKLYRRDEADGGAPVTVWGM